MSHELKEGVKLKAITTPPDPEDGCGQFRVGNQFHDGAHGTTRLTDIVVTEQLGQMGMVPWAKVMWSDGRTILVNLANVESVELA